MPQNAAFIAKNQKTNALQPGVLDQAGGLMMAPTLEAPTLAGFLFSGSNIAAATGIQTSVALAATYTGMCLSNPAGSGKNLILQAVQAGLMVAPSTITTLGLIAGYVAAGITVHTTPLLVLANGFINNAAASVAKLDAACTLVGTPYWARLISQCSTATTAPFNNVAIDGSIIIPPGGYVAIGTNIASPALGLGASMIWEEVPI